MKSARKTAGSRGGGASERERRSARTRSETPRVLVLSGPNLDRLGRREPEIYGTTTLAAIHRELAKRASALGYEVDCRQSNHEGDLIDWVGGAKDSGFAGIVINPGALTHTSIALFDALKAAGVPAVEVHLSNPEAREPFRRRSRTAPACVGKVAGFGGASYSWGLEALVQHLSSGSAAGSVVRARRAD